MKWAHMLLDLSVVLRLAKTTKCEWTFQWSELKGMSTAWSLVDGRGLRSQAGGVALSSRLPGHVKTVSVQMETFFVVVVLTHTTNSSLIWCCFTKVIWSSLPNSVTRRSLVRKTNQIKPQLAQDDAFCFNQMCVYFFLSIKIFLLIVVKIRIPCEKDNTETQRLFCRP